MLVNCRHASRIPSAIHSFRALTLRTTPRLLWGSMEQIKPQIPASPTSRSINCPFADAFVL